jgi:hypothetical protein
MSNETELECSSMHANACARAHVCVVCPRFFSVNITLTPVITLPPSKCKFIFPNKSSSIPYIILRLCITLSFFPKPLHPDVSAHQ